MPQGDGGKKKELCTVTLPPYSVIDASKSIINHFFSFTSKACSPTTANFTLSIPSARNLNMDSSLENGTRIASALEYPEVWGRPASEIYCCALWQLNSIS